MQQFLLALTLLIAAAGFAQVGVGTTTPDASSALDVDVSALSANAKQAFCHRG
jgi:hypothetical protein